MKNQNSLSLRMKNHWSLTPKDVAPQREPQLSGRRSRELTVLPHKQSLVPLWCSFSYQGSPTHRDSTSLRATRCPQLSRHCNAALRHPYWGGRCLQSALHPSKEVAKSAELQQVFHTVFCWIEFDNFQNKYVILQNIHIFLPVHVLDTELLSAPAEAGVLPWSPHFPPACCSHFSLSFSQSLKVTVAIPLPQLPCVAPVWWPFTPFLWLLLCLFSTWWFQRVEEHFHPLLMWFSAL